MSFMSFYDTRYIINNNILILPDDCYMAAAMMNHSEASNNHEHTETQTKKQSVVLHLKINLGTERFIQGGDSLLTKLQG